MTSVVTVTNPCIATTIEDITFDAASLTVVDGQTGQVSFAIPGDGVDTANGLIGNCGTKVYTV
mgnify:CR=1 FL=1